MLWLQPTPWARWAAVAVISAVAVWVEFGPEPTVEHPFASVDIARGELITEANTEPRRVPGGLLGSAPNGGSAARAIPAGSPILARDTTDAARAIPTGWWVVSAEVPSGAVPGDPVRVVLVDTGAVVEGVVTASGSGDPFDGVTGSLAVPEETAGEVAAAVTDGRAVVLVGTG